MKLNKAIISAFIAAAKDEDTEIELPDSLIAKPETKPTPNPTENPPKPSEPVLKAGWLKEDGTIDLTKVTDASVAAELKTLNDSVIAKNNDAIINSAIETEMKGINFNAKPETVLKLLDKTGMKVSDGKVSGVKEAFDALKKAEPALFKPGKPNQTSPIEEGFSPANNNNTDVTKLSDAQLIELAMSPAD